MVYSMSVLDIKPIQTNKSGIHLTPLMKQNLIPSFPDSILIVGSSGSGKSTFLINLMTNEHMYGNYFDFVYLFARTGKIDDSFKHLKIKESRIFKDEYIMIDELKNIVKIMNSIIEKKGIDKAPKVALIFEDLTANKKLMNDSTFLDVWTAGRHINLQIIASIHKYKSLPRTQRLQAMNIIYFRGSNSEVKSLAEDFTPPRHTEKEFMRMVDYATEKKNKHDHNFLFIANVNKVGFIDRYRKNFTELLKLKK